MRPSNSVRLNLEELTARVNPALVSYVSGTNTVVFNASADVMDNITVTSGSGTITITDSSDIVYTDASSSPYVTSSSTNSVTLSGSFAVVQILAHDMDDTITASSRVHALSLPVIPCRTVSK